MDRRTVVVEGRGLHGGNVARVTLAASSGPTTLNGAELAAWRAVPAERATLIACGEMRARTVEHLFAALAGAGLQRGVEIRLEGDEAPILDGGAAEWTEALRTLGVASSAPSIAVAHDGAVDVATSRYVFARGDETRVSIELELDDARIEKRAEWTGDADDFRARIAPARTFCFAGEVAELARRGLASYVKPETVIVIGEEIFAAGRPFEPDEPARHKLLDLSGDLFLYGGPPRGSVSAYRPGHWATHEAIRIAFARGILVPAARDAR